MTVLNEEIQAKLSNIKFKCFALESWAKKNGKKKVLKLQVVPKGGQGGRIKPFDPG